MSESSNTFRCLVFYAAPYSITDDKGRVENSGISLQFIVGDSLLPTEDKASGTKGISISKCSLPLDAADLIADLPAVYDVGFTIRNVSGKPTLTPQTLKYVHSVDLKPFNVSK